MLNPISLWIRAIVAISAGYFADRFKGTKIIIVSFALTVLGGLFIGFGILDQLSVSVFINLALTMIGVYGVRAIYFAIMDEAGIPLVYTGTTVGIVSVIGFTPDIFMGPWMGQLLDKNPGVVGHQNVFLLLALFSFIGLFVSILFRNRVIKRRIVLFIE